jgi:Flp pilus assembly protein TadB
MKLPWDKKSPIENLFDAYKIGEMPFALVVLGATCLVGAVAEEWTSRVGGQTLTIVGGAIIVAGGAVWALTTYLRSRYQLAVLALLEKASSHVAGMVKDGANYQVALDHITKMMPSLLTAMTTPTEKSK